jgi:hypothetical protein
MNWKLVAAIVAAGLVATFTDWLFMGVLFHERYNKYPDVWWPNARGETRRILFSSGLAFVTAAALVILCWMVGADDYESALAVAALAWIAGPLVNVVTNNIWIKFDPAVSVAHAVGYLVRFLLAGAAYVLIAA